ncbi:aldehyde dehydrogenase family protein [Pseudooceanicola algae]|uniref:aldehyde dehydrogenase (NAD(+)) n=1 Tax=Pseudooceanicola algae TaxID=1537215 RepID=A0A418SD07_9RHOB|nr:aldehyde dehydrogenase family protein [Pseudooceanicola algae]QPM92366.1 3-succinoylsemialdehyde-pyridine dehydrogenase [Pseudooceanicola algae]
MITLDKFYINGEWVAPDAPEDMPILTPSTNAKVGVVSLGNAADVDKAVAAAKAAFETFSLTSKEERLALLRRLAEVTRARLDDLARAITMEMGAPSTMSRAVQADAGIGHLEAFITALEAHDEQETLPNGDIVSYEPIGVCGLITPWNWPINQIALKVLPALATGATCVLKPSEHTPLSAQIYAEIIHEAGYPAGVFNLVYGAGPTVGSALSTHKDVAMMSFTGSTRAGSAVSRDAAATIKRVTLELGGKSPNVIFADADVDARVAEGVAECFDNTGQSCNAPTRMLVERSAYDRALEVARSAAEAQVVDDPALEGDHIGPLFDQIQYDRVQAMIQKGLDEGTRLLAGGPGRPEGLSQGLETGWFVRPTIFADVTPEMTLWREEIFGPVLVMAPFDTEEEAIALANDTDYGLDAYLSTGDEARALRVARRLRAGGIHINGRGTDYGSPFGGFKQSGNGREGGRFGLEDYLEVKVRPPFAV